MGKKSGGGTTTSTSTVSLPPWLDKQASFAAGEARRLYDTLGFFPGQTYADPSTQTMDAIRQIEAIARGENPLLDYSNQLAQDVLGGKFLAEGNPYLQQLIDDQSQSFSRNYNTNIAPQVAADFAKGGRYGSGLYSNAQQNANIGLAEGLSDIDFKNRYANYADQTARQDRYMSAIPQLYQNQMLPAQTLAGVGDFYTALEQQKIDEDMARYYYPQQNLGQFINQIAGLPHGSTTVGTQTQPKTGSTFGNILSAGLGIASLFAGGGPLAGLSLFGGGGGAGLALGGSGLGGLVTSPFTGGLNFGAPSNFGGLLY